MTALAARSARRNALLYVALYRTALEPERSTNRRDLEEASRLLRLAIQNELTERQRACLTLYYIEGHTMQEIAELLGTTRGNVSKRIKNAVERLRRALRYSAPGLKFSR